MHGKINPVAIRCGGEPEDEGSGTMLLAIDVGNTQTVLGVYENKKLRFRWRVATNKLHTCDELRVKLIPLLSSEGVSFDDISGVALASVVPALTEAWCQARSETPGTRSSRSPVVVSLIHSRMRRISLPSSPVGPTLTS